MPESKRKRKYTFRKGEVIPYESGSLMHESIKAQREAARNLISAFEPRRTRKRKQLLF